MLSGNFQIPHATILAGRAGRGDVNNSSPRRGRSCSMGTHMKTTLDIADGLLIEAKRVAAERRITLRALVEEALERTLFAEAHEPNFRLRDASVDGRGAAGWHELTDDQRTAAMYGDLPSLITGRQDAA